MASSIFGLDISDRSAEIVSLFEKKGRIHVGSFGRAELPAGTIQRGVIHDVDTLSKILAALLDATFGEKRGKLQAGVALSELAVYAKVFSLPGNLGESMVGKAAAIEASDIFPVQLERTFTDYTILVRSKEGQDVYFAAADRQAVDAYREVLRRIGIQPLFLDSEAMTLVRSLVPREEPEATLIADIGAQTTLLVVYDRGGVRLSSNIAVGGDHLSSAIEVKLNIPLEKAEKMKREEGLDPGKGDGRTFLILQQPMNDIIKEMEETVNYYAAKSGRKITKIILAGGTSLMPGIEDYITQNFAGAVVSRGDPLPGIGYDHLAEAEEFGVQAIFFATAIGLATRANGIRRTPGIDLLGGAKHDSDKPSIFSKLSSLVSKIIPMAPRAKKTTASKRKKDAAIEPAVSFDLPAVPIVPATSSITPPPALTVAPAATPEQAAVSEHSSGRDVGDLLGSVIGSAASTVPALVPAPTPIESEAPHQTVEDILGKIKAGGGASLSNKGKKTVAHRALAEEEDGGGGSKLRTIGLIVLVLVLLAAAALGVIKLLDKTGFSVSSLFGKKKPAEVATVTEQASGELASVNAIFIAGSVQETVGERPFLLTRVIETDVEASGTYVATGQGTAAEGKASGVITVTNDTDKDYSFVPTTRFLSKEGVLFRLIAQSPIPAHGTAKVNVAADKPGPSGDIGPTTFTIPGLGAALADKVYGRSESAMTGGAGSSTGIALEDLIKAKAELAEKLKTEALNNFKVMVNDGEALLPELLTSQDIELTAPAEGASAKNFTMTYKLKYRALLIPEKDVLPLLETIMGASLPAGKTATSFTLGTPLYVVQAYDTQAGRAEIWVEAPVRVAE